MYQTALLSQTVVLYSMPYFMKTEVKVNEVSSINMCSPL